MEIKVRKKYNKDYDYDYHYAEIELTDPTISYEDTETLDVNPERNLPKRIKKTIKKMKRKYQAIYDANEKTSHLQLVRQEKSA